MLVFNISKSALCLTNSIATVYNFSRHISLTYLDNRTAVVSSLFVFRLNGHTLLLSMEFSVVILLSGFLVVGSVTHVICATRRRKPMK